jgi:hypothetical protein
MRDNLIFMATVLIRNALLSLIPLHLHSGDYAGLAQGIEIVIGRQEPLYLKSLVKALAQVVRDLEFVWKTHST